MSNRYLTPLLATVLGLACQHQAGPTTFPPPCVAERNCSTPVVVRDPTLAAGTVQGIVLNRFDTGPIVQAQVLDMATNQHVLTDTHGEFTIANLKVGGHTLRI